MTNRTLELLIVLIVIFYLLGAFTTFVPMGNLVHLLLVVVLALVILRVLSGRKPL